MPTTKDSELKRISSLDNVNFQYDHKKHRISFYYALRGIGYAFGTQPNFRFHTFALVLAVILGMFFRISTVEFGMLFIVSGFVLVSEMLNTALEALGDEVSDGHILKLIGVAKDISAGAVFISAFTAVVVAFFIFLPHL